MVNLQVEIRSPGTETKVPLHERGVRKSAIRLCSRVRGRDRWHVDRLENSPRLAAAVELVLRTEPGVKEARVNPLTGRILVHYEPALIREAVDALIHRALEFGPMSKEEFSLLRGSSNSLSSKHLIAAEIGCSLFQMITLGGCCPLGLAAVALLLLVRKRVAAHAHLKHSAKRQAARTGSDETS